MKLLGWIALLLAALVRPLSAQVAPPAPTSAQDSSDAPTVYLMTMGPGELVWERFGHNAIWIHDPVRGTDMAYDYGRFDFQQENFILRFIQGRMLYWMDGAPVDAYIRHYRRDNRSVWIQELNLPPEARRELQAFLEWNVLPENRYYRYDYYRDNCSTRIRDAIDRVLHGQLRAATESVYVNATYRSHTQRLTENDIPIYTGLLAALGPAVDRPLTSWDEMFLPLALRDHVRHVTVRDSAGNEVPLVKSERTLYESTAVPPPNEPSAWTLRFLAAGIVIGAIIAALSQMAPASAGARIAVAGIGAVWGLVVGVAGLVLAGLWLATDHAAAYRNFNLFYLNPVTFPLAVLFPAAAFGASWARRAAWWVAVAALGLSIVGLVVEALPGVGQVNGPIVALVLPIQAGIAYAARGFARQSESRMPSIAASTVRPGATRPA